MNFPRFFGAQTTAARKKNAATFDVGDTVRHCLVQSQRSLFQPIARLVIRHVSLSASSSRRTRFGSVSNKSVDAIVFPWSVHCFRPFRTHLTFESKSRFSSRPTVCILFLCVKTAKEVSPGTVYINFASFLLFSRRFSSTRPQ